MHSYSYIQLNPIVNVKKKHQENQVQKFDFPKNFYLSIV